MFAAALGITAADADNLRAQLLAAARVEVLAPGVVEVEFSDNQSGRAFAMLPLRAEQLLALHYNPNEAA